MTSNVSEDWDQEMATEEYYDRNIKVLMIGDSGTSSSLYLLRTGTK